MRPRVLLTASLLTLLALTGCATTAPDPPAAEPGATTPAASTPQTSTPTPAEPVLEPRPVEGTIVRFTAGTTSVDVTIGADNTATRDFLSMLPLTLSFEEFSGREKISYLPRELDITDTPGSDPEDGDLIYFVPWGNLGFYYNTAGIGYSDQTINIGTYNATLAELEELENGDVTVEIIQ